MSRRGLWMLVAIGVVLVGLGVWLVVAKLPTLLSSPTSGAVPVAATPAATPAATRKIHATLFYVSSNGDELVPVSHEVPYGSTPGEQARRIIEAQIQPPPAGMLSAIPAGTTLRTIYLTPNGQAYVDFSPEIAKNHTGGSLDEILAVYAIVDALTVNLADVSSVQILVDGKEVDTLAGHVDLRTPLVRSLKWIRKGQ
ncbi:MAG TPA: GerMN domain-containing protein [Vicinamibacterales bacterium]|nr:GerMN domain-containing protein [Vicinamibacterales bacterium]